MARPVYTHELADPDIQWLINTLKETRKDLVSVEVTCLPVILIKVEEAARISTESTTFPEPPPIPPTDMDDLDDVEDGKERF